MDTSSPLSRRPTNHINLPFLSSPALQMTTDRPNATAGQRGLYGLSPDTVTHLLYALVTLSAITIITNILVLVLSKFASGGKSSTLIFLRSLCVADTLIGIFGMFKCALLHQNPDHRIINCFLPESLFISASTAIFLTLFWLNVDTYLRLSDPLGMINRMDKHNVIITMMILWNLAFIAGFLPHMGWNRQEFKCNMFLFYDMYYIMLVTVIWTVCMVGCWFTHVKLYKICHHIQQNNSFISARSREFQKYMQLIKTIRNDIILLTLCYLPLLTYLVYYYFSQQLAAGNESVVLFLPVFLVRSLISAFLHSYRTRRLQRLMHDVSKHVGHMSLCGHVCYSGQSNDCAGSSDQSIICSRVSLDMTASSHQQTHRKLHATDSSATVLSDTSLNTINENPDINTKL